MVDENKIYISLNTIAVTSEVVEPKSTDIKELEKLLTPPLTIGSNIAGSALVSSQKDQIEVLAGATKTNVRDLSGRKQFARSRVPQILNYFVDTFEIDVNSYGINFIVKVPCREPMKWISENILSEKISERTGKEVVGGSGLISLRLDPKIINMKFEAGERNNISVDFNASEVNKILPDKKRLCEELKEQWDNLVKILNGLGL